MKVPRVYLDHAATTPLGEAGRAALLAQLDAPAANPSSPHEEGRAAKDALEDARSRTARVLGCRPREVIFTSGATEALQIALHGAARARSARSRRIVISAVEHVAVREPAEALAAEGFELVRVPVDREGRIDAGRFLEAVGSEAAVAALMLANHESGAVMPVREVAEALAERGVPLLCDATLGPGRLEVGVKDLGADLVALSGHKFNGPSGSGLLFVRRGTRIARWLRGGLQEERLRPGMENVAACAGLAAALEVATAQRAQRAARDGALIDVFLQALDEMGEWRRLGPPAGALPGLVTLELPGVEGEAAMINMDLEGFAVATGSTCALGSSDPSPALLAMGLSKRRAASTLRISVGEGVESEDMRRAASSLRTVVSRLRALAAG